MAFFLDDACVGLGLGLGASGAATQTAALLLTSNSWSTRAVRILRLQTRYDRRDSDNQVVMEWSGGPVGRYDMANLVSGCPTLIQFLYISEIVSTTTELSMLQYIPTE
jgi:hypothetical protein